MVLLVEKLVGVKMTGGRRREGVRRRDFCFGCSRPWEGNFGWEGGAGGGAVKRWCGEVGVEFACLGWGRWRRSKWRGGGGEVGRFGRRRDLIISFRQGDYRNIIMC